MSTTYALRRGRELNPRMAVLQTAALPLRHHAFLLFVGVLSGHCPPGRNRTYDRLLKRQLLYRLSYERKRMNEYTRINLKINKIKNLAQVFYFVPGVGLEPTSLTAKDFKSFVYTIPPSGQNATGA